MIHLLTWKPTGTKAQLANLRKVGKLARALDKLLTRYKVYPEISPSSKGRWYQRWRSIGRHDEAQITVSAKGDTYPFGEEDILLAVLDLAKRGFLERVRRCRYCEKWFFARVRHQKFCTRDCQQSNFRTSKEFRAKRKFYMRRYRRAEYKRARKAKVVAQLK